MPQIIIATKGGLGDILFQLLAGLHFARTHHLKIAITHIPSNKKPYTYYNFLSNLHKNFISFDYVQKYIRSYKGYILFVNDHNYYRILKKYNRKTNKNIYINGIFQNNSFFTNKIDIIKKNLNYQFHNSIKDILYSYIHKTFDTKIIGLYINNNDKFFFKNNINDINQNYYYLILNLLFSNNIEQENINVNNNNKIINYKENNNSLLENTQNDNNNIKSNYIENLNIDEFFDKYKENINFNKLHSNENSNILKDISILNKKFKIIIFSEKKHRINKDFPKLSKFNDIIIYADDIPNIMNIDRNEFEFIMMQFCDILICSNSTTSVFSSYLGNQKYIYLPKNWYKTNKNGHPNKFVLNNNFKKYFIY